MSAFCLYVFFPRVEFSTPEEFFHNVEQHDAHKLCHWSGELYLELHNGTYTTQAKVCCCFKTPLFNFESGVFDDRQNPTTVDVS
jgi:hypothetical protein